MCTPAKKEEKSTSFHRHEKRTCVAIGAYAMNKQSKHKSQMCKLKKVHRKHMYVLKICFLFLTVKFADVYCDSWCKTYLVTI